MVSEREAKLAQDGESFVLRRTAADPVRAAQGSGGKASWFTCRSCGWTFDIPRTRLDVLYARFLRQEIRLGYQQQDLLHVPDLISNLQMI